MTAVYPEAGQHTNFELNYLIIGLVGEAGELANKWKKLLRAGEMNIGFDQPINLTQTQVNTLLDEAGDTLWYLARVLKTLGYSFDQLSDINVTKLTNRKVEGQLGSPNERY